MTNDLLYQIALTLVPGIGEVHAKSLVEYFGCAEDIFRAKKKELESIEGIGTIRANSIKKFENFSNCEKEIAFLEHYKITTFFINDQNYPQRLLHCYDSPTLLFYKGNANLNTSKIVSIVGTRNNSDYGKAVCESLIEELQKEDILVVSGLALGIDTIAHKAALKNNLATVGVLAHGLDRIYPYQNKALAMQMIEQGGLLTEFLSNTLPDRQNFPKRNRIVAGMCDAVIVVESSKKGGSLITAELGNSYNKDIFAIPGRINDSKSEGCNYLIKTNKAALATCAKDILDSMGWLPRHQPVRQKQRTLFIELSDNEKKIVALLQQQENMHIDELYFKSSLSSSQVASALLMLEMQCLVAALPGKLYKLV